MVADSKCVWSKRFEEERSNGAAIYHDAGVMLCSVDLVWLMVGRARCLESKGSDAPESEEPVVSPDYCKGGDSGEANCMMSMVPIPLRPDPPSTTLKLPIHVRHQPGGRSGTKSGFNIEPRARLDGSLSGVCHVLLRVSCAARMSWTTSSTPLQTLGFTILGSRDEDKKAQSWAHDSVPHCFHGWVLPVEGRRCLEICQPEKGESEDAEVQ